MVQVEICEHSHTRRRRTHAPHTQTRVSTRKNEFFFSFFLSLSLSRDRVSAPQPASAARTTALTRLQTHVAAAKLNLTSMQKSCASTCAVEADERKTTAVSFACPRVRHTKQRKKEKAVDRQLEASLNRFQPVLESGAQSNFPSCFERTLWNTDRNLFEFVFRTHTSRAVPNQNVFACAARRGAVRARARANLHHVQHHGESPRPLPCKENQKKQNEKIFFFFFLTFRVLTRRSAAIGDSTT